MNKSKKIASATTPDKPAIAPLTYVNGAISEGERQILPGQPEAIPVVCQAAGVA